MKHLFIAVAVATMGFFASCSKENEDIIAPPTGDDNKDISVSLSLNTDAIQTRAFFDNSTALESWEKALHKVTVLAVEFEHGKVLARRDLTASELQSGKVTFSSPNFKEGDYLGVMVLANFDVPQSFDDLMETDQLISPFNISEYNGTFSEVAYGAKRRGGFIMADDDGATLTASDNRFDMQLVGIAAKVALDLSLSNEFSERYSGELKVNNVTVSNTSMKVTDSNTDFIHTQVSSHSNGHYRNLFYLLDRNPLFTINATYDRDGNFSTTSDQQAVVYSFTLKNEQGNPIEMSAHTYYRITGKIRGLDESETPTEITITVTDWESNESFDIEV